MAATKRSPQVDPKPGDKLILMGSARFREVVARNGNDIVYKDHTGKERTCWITSWMDWCRKQDFQSS